jgi:uncharacterized protein
VEANEPIAERVMTPLHPDYRKVLRIRAAIASLFPLFIAVSVELGAFRDGRLPPGLVTAVVAALALLAILLLPQRRYRAWGYQEGEDELHIRRGLLVRTRTVVPFGRVQHIDIAQGPVERRYHLATLILHTAGTRGAAVPLPGLDHQLAEGMRDRIRGKIRQDLA